LAEAGVTAEARIVFGDEMRVGLHGQVRRRWCPRGIKLVQRQQIQYVWRYLMLMVDVQAGRLHWCWLERLRKEVVREAILPWSSEIDAIVWDSAPSHKAKVVKDIDIVMVNQPPYSPEVNPPERLFEELRREIEGDVYGTIDDKIAKVDAFLNQLASDPARVKQLLGWQWIRDSLAQLPSIDHVALA